MPQTEKPLFHALRIQSQILSGQFLGGPPVANRYIQKHTLAGEHVQYMIIILHFRLSFFRYSVFNAPVSPPPWRTPAFSRP